MSCSPLYSTDGKIKYLVNI